MSAVFAKCGSTRVELAVVSDKTEKLFIRISVGEEVNNLTYSLNALQLHQA